MLQVGEAESREVESRERSAKKLKAAVSREARHSDEKLMVFGSASLDAVEAVRVRLNFDIAALDQDKARLAAENAAEVKRRMGALKTVGSLQNRLQKAKEEKTKLEADCASLMDELDEQKDDLHSAAVDEWVLTEKARRQRDVVPKGLLEMCGKKGEAYSLEMQELGMELMSGGLTAPEARAVLIIFMKKACPDATMGIDCRIPDPATFKRWRTFLEPLSQFMALRAVDRAKIVHLLHYATSKKVPLPAHPLPTPCRHPPLIRHCLSMTCLCFFCVGGLIFFGCGSGDSKRGDPEHTTGLQNYARWCCRVRSCCGREFPRDGCRRSQQRVRIRFAKNFSEGCVMHFGRSYERDQN